MKFMMQSCLMVAGEICDGGSKILEGFKSPLDATAYKKCVDAGMEFAGLVTPSEFGTDSLFSESEDKDSAVDALLEGKCDVVLCNDVYGKHRRDLCLFSPHTARFPVLELCRRCLQWTESVFFARAPMSE